MAMFRTPRPYQSFWGSQRMADEVYGAQTADSQGHFPYARPLQLDWELTPTGYRARGRDPERAEVVCAGCGDEDGPSEVQPGPARRLRGPYPDLAAATRAASDHERATQPSRAELRAEAVRAKAAAGGGMLSMFLTPRVARALALRPPARSSTPRRRRTPRR